MGRLLGGQGMIVELSRAIRALEDQLTVMRHQHGNDLYWVKTPDGNYIAAPILTALVNGYSALAQLKREKHDS